MKYISEGDLYRLIIRSKLPAAVRFDAWVCDKILPSIRKHGAYNTDDALVEMFRNSKLADMLIRRLAEKRTKSIALEEHAEDLSPKARYCDLVLHSKNVVPVSLIARD